MITKEQFMQFVTVYHDRYGDWNMGPETMKMWHSRVKHLEWDKFKSVYQELIGKHPKPFGWKSIIVLNDAMFPPEDPTLAMKRQYENNPDRVANTVKRAEMTKVMAGLMASLETARRRGKSPDFDWIAEYAHRAVEVFGEKEIHSICAQLMSNDYVAEESRIFCAEVHKTVMSS